MQVRAIKCMAMRFEKEFQSGKQVLLVFLNIAKSGPFAVGEFRAREMHSKTFFYFLFCASALLDNPKIEFVII